MHADSIVEYFLDPNCGSIRFENLAVPGVPSNDPYLCVYTFLCQFCPSLRIRICTCVMTSKDSLPLYGPIIMKTATHQTSGGVWELKYSKNLRIKCSSPYFTVQFLAYTYVCHVYGS